MKPREPCWEPRFSPLFYWTQVPETQVQARMRPLFERWGLPERIRVDNGAPWGGWSDLAPALALWWVGLGITPIWNHPHCPKENAFVERCNGLVGSWAEPSLCPDWPTWQQK